MGHVKVSEKLWEPIKNLVNIGLYKNEKDAIRSLIQGQAEKKIKLYSEKIRKLEKKYGMGFQKFEKKIKDREGKEVFEEWDDYVSWKGYEESLKYWAKVKEGISA